MKRNNNNPPDEQPDPKRQKTVPYDEIGANVANMALKGVLPPISLRNKIKELNRELEQKLQTEKYLNAADKKGERAQFLDEYIAQVAGYLESNLQWGLTVDDLKYRTIPNLRANIWFTKQIPDPDEIVEEMEGDLLVKIYNTPRYTEPYQASQAFTDAKRYLQIREPTFTINAQGNEVLIPKNNEYMRDLEQDVAEAKLRDKARAVSKAFSLLWGRAVEPEEVWKHFASRHEHYRERKEVINDIQMMEAENNE